MIRPHTVKRLRRLKNKIPVFFITASSTVFLPLSLGMIRACLEHGPEKDLMRQYLPMPFLSAGAQDFAQITRTFSPAMWLFSDYVWSEKINLETSRQLKRIHPDNLIIHGGPSVPRRAAACQAFLRRHPWVDLAILGEGEMTALEFFHCLGNSSDLIPALEAIPGIAFLAAADGEEPHFMLTPPRAAMEHLDDLPSPYLTGLFDNLPHYSSAALETTRGCPHHCAYCDWSGLDAKRIRSFHLDRIKGEIEWAGQHRIDVLFVNDANFGLAARDMEVAAWLAETKKRYGFPQEVMISFTKNTLQHIPAIVNTLVNAGLTAQGIIPLQTIDEQTLENIGRQKLKAWYVDGLRDIFQEQNLPISADLILGLPGATVATFKHDLQYCFDRDLLAKPYNLQVLPNSRLAAPEYRAKFRIAADEDGMVQSTYSYNREDRRRMVILKSLYQWFEGRGLLRYVLRYLQWDYAIPALDFMDQFISHLQESPESCPSVRLDSNLMFAPEVRAGNWSLFYRDLAAYILGKYAVSDTAAFRTVFAVNTAAMPRPGRKSPETLSLPHDYVSYFLHNRSCALKEHRLLSQYSAGEFTTQDPYGLSNLDMFNCCQFNVYQFFWELDSPLARRSSPPYFTYAPAHISENLKP